MDRRKHIHLTWDTCWPSHFFPTKDLHKDLTNQGQSLIPDSWTRISLGGKSLSSLKRSLMRILALPERNSPISSAIKVSSIHKIFDQGEIAKIRRAYLFYFWQLPVERIFHSQRLVVKDKDRREIVCKCLPACISECKSLMHRLDP